MERIPRKQSGPGEEAYKIEYEGYLKKRSPKVVMGHRFWQTRYFVLKTLKEGRHKGKSLDVVIEYYKNSNAFKKKMAPLGKMYCTYLKNVAYHPKGRAAKPGKFRIELDGDHIFYLQASTPDDADQWFERLSALCQNFKGTRPANFQQITTKKYWKQEHLDLQTQGHTQRKRTMSQALPQELLDGIKQDTKQSNSGLRSESQSVSQSVSTTPVEKGTPKSSTDMSEASPVVPSGTKGGGRKNRYGDKMKAKMARAEEARKRREEQIKQERAKEATRNEEALKRLKKVIDRAEKDRTGFEMLFRIVKTSKNMRSPEQAAKMRSGGTFKEHEGKKEEAKSTPAFSFSVTDEKGKKSKVNIPEKKEGKKKRVGGVRFNIPDEPEEKLVCPRITDVEDQEREQQVIDIKKFLQKKYKLTDFHVGHLENRIIDMYDYGEDRANQELQDMCQALNKRTWDLLGRIGQGGFGAVYKGKWRGKSEKNRKNIIAIKIIDLEAEEEEDISIVNREIDALTKSQFCDQLTKYYGSGISGSELWIAMEFVDGGSIQGIVKKKAMTEEQIAVVCKDVILGLQYLLQDGGKIHRDIKGANILVCSDGKVKLADFGASRTLSQTGAHKAATFIGSPFWMAPEIVENKNYDGKVDIWSLGCTCIEMATQHPPNYNLPAEKAIMKIMTSTPPRLPPGFSKEFNEFVNACLTKDAVLRPDLDSLLKFPFIQNAPSNEVLAKVRQEVDQRK